jgi:hypothetical protein
VLTTVDRKKVLMHNGKMIGSYEASNILLDNYINVAKMNSKYVMLVDLVDVVVKTTTNFSTVFKQSISTTAYDLDEARLYLLSERTLLIYSIGTGYLRYDGY